MIPHTGFLAGLDVRDTEVLAAVGEYTAGELAVVGLGRAAIAGREDSDGGMAL